MTFLEERAKQMECPTEPGNFEQNQPRLWAVRREISQPPVEERMESSFNNAVLIVLRRTLKMDTARFRLRRAQLEAQTKSNDFKPKPVWTHRQRT